MRGTKAKAQRRIRNADFAQLEHAVNHNYMMAAAMREGLSQALMLNFWANVAMAAVLQHLANDSDNNRSVGREDQAGALFHEIEKATFFEPSGVEI